jgi:predicted GNAT family acetyltransferase
MIDIYQVGEASCNLSPFEEKGFNQNHKVKWLTNLYVPEEHRQKGLAKALLSQLGKEADEAQIALIIECRAFEEDSITEDALEAMYKRQGFVVLQKEPKLMIRIPVPPMLFESLKQKQTSRIITNLYN